MFTTPHTADGRIVRILQTAPEFIVEATFQVSSELRQQLVGREAYLNFAARSRLARLGVDILPLHKPQLEGEQFSLQLRILNAIPAFGFGEILRTLIVPGLFIGRLVFCPPEQKLDSSAIADAIAQGLIQLPQGYSVDATDHLILRPSPYIYNFAHQLTPAELKRILYHADGKKFLDQLQLAHKVHSIHLPSQQGLITSCSMFLHRHYVVLENLYPALGYHLQALLLDPVTTRGTNIFFEFINHGEQIIINPTIAASVYHAVPAPPIRRLWTGAHFDTLLSHDHKAQLETTDKLYQNGDYARLHKLFDQLEEHAQGTSGIIRRVALMRDDSKLLVANFDQQIPEQILQSNPTATKTLQFGANSIYPKATECPNHAVLDMLDAQEPGAGMTILLSYFPNIEEQVRIYAAALAKKLARLVFRRASVEHGAFLSANDHSCLALLHRLGVEVFWCNDDRQHVAQHIYRNERGYFCVPEHIEAFRSSMIFAIYGSTLPISKDREHQLGVLLDQLVDTFGPDISILTGGGPGIMQQMTELAQQRGLMVGSSYIEANGQARNRSADFYQTFQAGNRHNRQRWFDIASFQIFMTGGVGTLEEIGLTLTDLKLGVMERAPLLFIDLSEKADYWHGLAEQLQTMIDHQRAPAWLKEDVIFTSQVGEISEIYYQHLQLG